MIAGDFGRGKGKLRGQSPGGGGGDPGTQGLPRGTQVLMERGAQVPRGYSRVLRHSWGVLRGLLRPHSCATSNLTGAALPQTVARPHSHPARHHQMSGSRQHQSCSQDIYGSGCQQWTCMGAHGPVSDMCVCNDHAYMALKRSSNFQLHLKWHKSLACAVLMAV